MNTFPVAVFNGGFFLLCIICCKGILSLPVGQSNDSSSKYPIEGDVLSVSINGNGILTLPCFNKSMNRTGRVQVRKSDFIRNDSVSILQLSIFMPNCSGQSYFEINQGNRFSALESLYFNFLTTNGLLPGENLVVVGYGPLDASMTNIVSMVFTKPGNSASVLLDGRRQRSPVAVINLLQNDVGTTPSPAHSTGGVVSSRSPSNASTTITITPVVSAKLATSSLVLTSTDYQKDVITLTIDYTVVYRPDPKDGVSLRTALGLFQKSNETAMYYCEALNGFVPSKMCLSNATEPSDFMACPTQFYPWPSSPWITKAQCFSPAQTLENLNRTSTTPRTTYRTISPFGPWGWPTERPWTFRPPVIHIPTDTYDSNYWYNVRLAGAITASVFGCLSLVCSVLRYCVGRKAATTTTTVRTLGDFPQNSAIKTSDPNEHSLPTYETAQKTFNTLPSYEEVHQQGEICQDDNFPQNTAVGQYNRL